MANPFLVLGGIAISVATAAFGILQVPGWVAAAQDASATNDLTNVRQAQAISVSQAGQFALDFDTLGVKLTTESRPKPVNMDVTADAWCATVQSSSGTFFAASDRASAITTGETAKAAAAAAGCVIAPCEDDQWKIQYFDNITLDGLPVTIVCRSKVDWRHAASSGPATGVPSQNYSSRVSKTIDEGPGTYTFTLTADEGARVLIDGVNVWDKFESSGGVNRTHTFDVTLGDGAHDIVIEHHNGTLTGMLQVSYAVTG